MDRQKALTQWISGLVDRVRWRMPHASVAVISWPRAADRERIPFSAYTAEGFDSFLGAGIAQSYMMERESQIIDLRGK